MAVAFRSASDQFGTGTDITATEPSGAAQGDILIAMIVAGATATVTIPSGWTQLYTEGPNQMRYVACWIARGASAPSYTFTLSTSVFRQVTVWAFSGGDTTTPFSGQAAGSVINTTNVDPPSATPGTVDGMALAIAGHWGGANPFVPPSGYTLRGNTGLSDIGGATKALSSTAAEDPGTFTGPSGSNDAVGITLLLAPGAAPPATLSYDVETRFPSGATTDTTTGNRTFSHAGSSSAKAAVVLVMCTGTTPVVSGVLYGDMAMTLVQSATDTTEAGRVEAYVLTGGVPTGTQTVTLQGCTATAKWVTCATVIAPGRVEVNASNAVNTTVSTAAQVTLTTSKPACSFAGIHHGAAAPSASPVADNTLLHNMDYGALSANTVRRTAVDAAGSLALGVTIASDDFCAAGVAVAEDLMPFVIMAPMRR